jgi:hypothetical protein
MCQILWCFFEYKKSGASVDVPPVSVASLRCQWQVVSILSFIFIDFHDARTFPNTPRELEDRRALDR